MGFDPYVPLSEINLLDPTDVPTSQATPSPKFARHRAVSALDSLPEGRRTAGMNMVGYNVALILVVPKAGTPDPMIEVLSWDPVALRFAPFAPRLIRSGVGSGASYVFACNVAEATIWVSVIGGLKAGDEVEILIAGSRQFVEDSRSAESEHLIGATIADSIGTTDAATHGEHFATARDTVTVGDVLRSAADYIRSIGSDSATVGDEMKSAADYVRGAGSDSATVGDSVAREIAFLRDVSVDSMAAADAVVTEAEYAPSVSDAGVVVDGVATEAEYAPQVSDDGAIVDEVATEAEYAPQVSDSESVADDVVADVTT